MLGDCRRRDGGLIRWWCMHAHRQQTQRLSTDGGTWATGEVYCHLHYHAKVTTTNLACFTESYAMHSMYGDAIRSNCPRLAGGDLDTKRRAMI